ncbi:hypothetical protein PHSC3_001723 [Chlamydiales bacterium STE3]|nr:hypothetical protein PHSC3_001723 [Chlamydiales bacterium STE3]
MSEDLTSSSPVSTPSTGAPSTEANSGSSAPTSGGGGYTTSTTVATLAQLKEKAPQVYNAMMEGLAMNIVSKMRSDQAHLKQIMREGNRVFNQ